MGAAEVAYSEEILARARARLSRSREQREQDTAAQQERIYAQYPRLREIDNRLRSTVAEAMNAAFRTGRDPAETISALKQENLSLQRERNLILENAGLHADSLDAAPVCPECGGSGYRGAVMCRCLKDLCRQEQEKELADLLGTDTMSFNTFSLAYYSPQINPILGISPRENMRIVLEEVRNFAENFSSDSDSLLFSGGTGLGKTSLSACAAGTVAAGGYSVLYDTAVHMFSEFEEAKFRTGAETRRDRIQKYFLCDLLIIDDLGTEMTTQFTLSSLYTVINTRLMNRQPAIISTNLSMEEMKRRYTPQIVSRLEGSYKTLPFLGDDIRLLKRDEA